MAVDLDPQGNASTGLGVQRLDRGVGSYAIGIAAGLGWGLLRMKGHYFAVGSISIVEVLRLQRQVNDLRANLQERLNRFRADARADRHPPPVDDQRLPGES